MAGETVAADRLALEALLASRQYLYELFHALLGATPNAELLQALTSQETLDTVEEFAGDNASMAGFAAFLRVLAAKDAGELLAGAQSEYMRVFVGPAALPASPYESPYTGKHDMALFQENTVIVRRTYQAAGYQVKHLMRVPDDHVAIMCDFMAKLGGEALATLQRGDVASLARSLRTQQGFAERHLNGWLGIYATAVRNSKAGADAVMYPQLLEAFAAFVEMDRVFCQESAYWAETVAEGLEASAPSFPQIEEATSRVVTLDLLGLDDNTLIAC